MPLIVGWRISKYLGILQALEPLLVQHRYVNNVLILVLNYVWRIRGLNQACCQLLTLDIDIYIINLFVCTLYIGLVWKLNEKYLGN